MRKIIFYSSLLLCTILTGCDKFLIEKPRKGLVVPETIEQLLSLMRKENESMQDPTFGEISTDDYYWDNADLNSKTEPVRKAYSWQQKDVFGSESLTEWLFHYRFIYFANTVLEKLSDIKPVGSEVAEWNKAKGEALFYRGKFLYDLAIIWASAYNTPNRANELGMPIRLNTNFNERSYRSSLTNTYAQIIKDIEESITYLPDVAEHVTRPSKLAARAMAARIYLSMGDYEKALIHAEDVLKMKSELLDFRTLSASVAFPFPVFNKEVIFHSYMQFSVFSFYVNPSLWDSYSPDDLRKTLYFDFQNTGIANFKGSYYARSTLFSGLAVDEMYLIAAECHTRGVGLGIAKEYMHHLLAHRYKKDKAPILTSLSKEDLLDFILNERRKELVFRGVRWGDVKRLNNEGRDVRMSRYSKDGTVVHLEPHDLRYNLPIPERLIDLSDIVQNPR